MECQLRQHSITKPVPFTEQSLTAIIAGIIMENRSPQQQSVQVTNEKKPAKDNIRTKLK